MTDDRREFGQSKLELAGRMRADDRLRDLATELFVAADRYDYSYQWTWLGLPIIQLPQDILATQEIVWKTRPQVIVETGVARGGSMILLASLLELMGEGKVIGVDIDIRP